MEVRYAWQSFTDANLYNGAPLPASTFCGEGSLSRMRCDAQVSGPATKLTRWPVHLARFFARCGITTALYQRWFGVQNLETDFRGIPHLAKNQRDVGHLVLAAGRSGIVLAMAPAACRGHSAPPPWDIAGALCMLLGPAEDRPIGALLMTHRGRLRPQSALPLSPRCWPAVVDIGVAIPAGPFDWRSCRVCRDSAGNT